MQKKNLVIDYSNAVTGRENGEIQMTFESLVHLAKSRRFLKHIGRYRDVIFYCPGFTAFARPFLTAVICRLMASGSCKWVDYAGNQLKIGIAELFRQFFVFLRENLFYRSFLQEVSRDLDVLAAIPAQMRVRDERGRPLYLRCDLSYGYIAGGSIGHIAGVVNHLEQAFGSSPLFITSDRIPTVGPSVEQNILSGKIRFSNVRDIAGIAFNRICFKAIEAYAEREKIAFLYQRSALNSFAGVQYALLHKIPLVLEYNGSEVWISHQWGGRTLKAVQISEKIERLTFEKAALITCVSRPLKDQLVGIGIDGTKIIVTPNGVDPERYRPDLSGGPIRKKYHISGNAIVIGFIGTFGAWHGAEVLARAYVRLCRSLDPSLCIHMLFIGDGMRMPEVRAIIEKGGAAGSCTFTGVVPQENGPAYLAACDILASPQTRNPDGTPFFGSPTKLFEYMAMGKAIVASNLDQLAEVCSHENTALLCEPGNALELAKAIGRLLSDEALRKKLGENARREVCEKYTWEMHTKKIVAALRGLCERRFAGNLEEAGGGGEEA